MYYNMLTMACKPGKRQAAFGYLREFANWLTEEQGVPAWAFTNFTGSVYQVYLVGLFEGMGHYDRVFMGYLANDWFLDWFKRSGEALKWKTVSSHLWNIHRKTEMEADTQLVAMVSSDLKPGQRWQGVEHLKKLAEYIEETYQVPCEVLSDQDGSNYRHYVTMWFEDAGGYDRLQEQLIGDQAYAEWFAAAMENANVASMTFSFARRL